jgi:hypothetical protein
MIAAVEFSAGDGLGGDRESQAARHEDGVLNGIGVVGGAEGGLREAEGAVEGEGGVIGLANFEEDLRAVAGLKGWLKGSEKPAGYALALESGRDRDGFQLCLGWEDRDNDESGKAAGGFGDQGDALG